MAVAEGKRVELAQLYWKASLAWKNIGNWADGWTVGDFIERCRLLCEDQGRIGDLADNLLEDVIHDRERTEVHTAEIIQLRA